MKILSCCTRPSLTLFKGESEPPKTDKSPKTTEKQGENPELKPQPKADTVEIKGEAKKPAEVKTEKTEKNPEAEPKCEGENCKK